MENGSRKRALEIFRGTLPPQRSEEVQGRKMSSAVGDNDLWRRARVGFSVVGNDKPYINAKIDHILRFIDQLGLAEILRSRIEIASFDDLMDTEDIEEGKYE